APTTPFPTQIYTLSLHDALPISESDPTPTFDLSGLSCNDGASATASTVSLVDRKATFHLDPGETVTCTFTNRQRGTIIVKKITRSEEHTSELQSRFDLVCRLLLE